MIILFGKRTHIMTVTNHKECVCAHDTEGTDIPHNKVLYPQTFHGRLGGRGSQEDLDLVFLQYLSWRISAMSLISYKARSRSARV